MTCLVPAVLCLALGACTAPGDAEPLPQPERLSIVDVEPTEVALRGGPVDIAVRGALPSNVGEPFPGSTGYVVAINDHPVTSARSQDGLVATVPPTQNPGAFSVSILARSFDPSTGASQLGSELARLDDAGHYVPMFSAKAIGGTAEPLHPELARPCARKLLPQVRNIGDPLVVNSVKLNGSSRFSIQQDNCTGKTLPSGPSCIVAVCFSASQPGTYTANVLFHTDAGDLNAGLSASVLAPSAGVDISFAGTGAVALPVGDVQAAMFYGDGIAVGTSTHLSFITGGGQASSHRLSDYGYLGAPKVWAMRAAPSGTAFYVELQGANGYALGLFSAESSLVASLNVFAQAMEVQPTGRIVLGQGPTVRAFTADGAPDASFGANGVTDLSDYGTARVSAMDSLGRIYWAVDSGIVRLQPDGTVDPGFSSTAMPTAIAIGRDDHLVVFDLATSQVEHLDEGGAATATTLAPPSPITRVLDFDEDAKGRILVTTKDQGVLRFAADGTYLDTVGFELTQRVLCPASGGCFVAGDTAREGYALRLLP